MKKITLITALFLGWYIANAQTKNFIDQPYLEVVGSADTLITPNEIYIKINIQEKDTRDRISVEEQELKMVNALKSLGIDIEKNLTTNDMASNFKSYILKGKEVVKSKQYLLKVADAVTVSKVFIGLEELEISNSSIDRVDHSDLENYRNQMRQKAMQNALTRANALTKPLNQKIGPAIHVADNENYNLGNQLQGRLAGVNISTIKIRGAASLNVANIEFEKIPVATNIQVKFILGIN